MRKKRIWKNYRAVSAERRMVERATILLACAEGKQKQQIASELGMSTVRVGKWRSRFASQGLSGLHDEQRPGMYKRAIRLGLKPIKAPISGTVL